MSRSLFLLISGVYTTLLAISMVFVPDVALQNYGVPRVDLSHIAVIQFLGVSSGGFALLSILNHNVPNGYSLRTILLAQAMVTLAGVVLGIYHALVLHVPMSSFFVGDSVVRLAIGMTMLYFYRWESKHRHPLHQEKAGTPL